MYINSVLTAIIKLTLVALMMWIASPFRWTLTYSTMINSSANSFLSTRIEWCSTRILAEVLNAGFSIRTFRIKLALSNFD